MVIGRIVMWLKASTVAYMLGHFCKYLMVIIVCQCWMFFSSDSNQLTMTKLSVTLRSQAFACCVDAMPGSHKGKLFSKTWRKRCWQGSLGQWPHHQGHSPAGPKQVELGRSGITTRFSQESFVVEVHNDELGPRSSQEIKSICLG